MVMYQIESIRKKKNKKIIAFVIVIAIIIIAISIFAGIKVARYIANRKQDELNKKVSNISKENVDLQQNSNVELRKKQ